MGIDILATKGGYKKLFIGEKTFEKKFGIGTDELISKYNVEIKIMLIRS